MAPSPHLPRREQGVDLVQDGACCRAGAALGAFIIVGFRYELIALGAPSSWFISFVGAVLIVAVIFNQKFARMAGRSVCRRAFPWQLP